MSYSQYLAQIKEIQKAILVFLEDENPDNIQYLIKLFDDTQICNSKHNLKSLFYLILKISNQHHRTTIFFIKIEKILLFFKKEMKQFFTNYEIFNIFKSSKRILLFLLKEKFIFMTKSIEFAIKRTKYSKANYQDYFCLEDKKQKSQKVIENFL